MTDRDTRPAHAAPRFHELDALRATAMLLGIVLHSLLFLMPHDADNVWPVQDVWATVVPPPANPYVHVYFLIHGFRMPLFFMLSGFFTAMLWQRRGLPFLVRHRLKRIGLPLALCIFTVIPVCGWLFSTLDPDHFGYFKPLFRPAVWLEDMFHLWFLWHLLLLMALFAVAVRLGVKFVSPGWWLLLPLTVPSMFIMSEVVVGPDTSRAMIPDPRVVGFYAMFFLFGAFFHERRIRMRRWWALLLIPAVVVAYPGSLLFVISEPGSLQWAATSAFQATYGWLMCFGMMGLAHRIGGRERQWMRYLSDSSYWLYLVHLPLVLIMQMLVVNVAMSVHLKVVLILAIVVPLLLAVYHLGVRYTWIGTMLNGPRYRRTTVPGHR